MAKKTSRSLQEPSKGSKSKVNVSGDPANAKQSVEPLTKASKATKDKKLSKEKSKPTSESHPTPSKPKVHFSADITREEMKQKKSTSSLEKKKAKATEGRMSGGIKESLVGKKSKSRI